MTGSIDQAILGIVEIGSSTQRGVERATGICIGRDAAVDAACFFNACDRHRKHVGLTGIRNIDLIGAVRQVVENTCCITRLSCYGIARCIYYTELGIGKVALTRDRGCKCRTGLIRDAGGGIHGWNGPCLRKATAERRIVTGVLDPDTIRPIRKVVERACIITGLSCDGVAAGIHQAVLRAGEIRLPCEGDVEARTGLTGYFGVGIHGRYRRILPGYTFYVAALVTDDEVDDPGIAQEKIKWLCIGPDGVAGRSYDAVGKAIKSSTGSIRITLAVCQADLYLIVLTAGGRHLR